MKRSTHVLFIVGTSLMAGCAHTRTTTAEIGQDTAKSGTDGPKNSNYIGKLSYVWHPTRRPSGN